MDLSKGKNMKIGIFGGSFDPPHLEHYYLAKSAVDSLALDKLIVIPAHTPPHKRGKTLTDDSTRFALCKLAFADLLKVEVSDYEMRKGGVSYTFETCEYFRSLYQDATLFWLVGTDMLRDFPTWRHPEKILENVTLAVCARAETGDWLKKEREDFYRIFKKEFAVIGYDGKEVSSTQIRVLSAAEENVAPLVGERMANYIKEKGLYRVPFAKDGLALLKPERKEHTFRVAELAVKRAPSLGIDERVAITASLFHDCAKYLDENHEYLKDFEVDQCVPAPVIHQFTGAYIAEKFFGVQDRDVLNAIRYHTSGRAGMSVLERLIFLADMLEPDRDFKGVDELRTLFWKKDDDLNHCMDDALKLNLAYLNKKNAPVYALTADALNYFKEKNQKEKKYGNHE